MSKKQKSKTGSVITVRALCDRCKEVDTFHVSVRDLLPHIGGLYQFSTIHHCKTDNKEMIMNIVLDRNFSVRQTTISPFVGEMFEGRWAPEKAKDIKFLVKTVKNADQAIHGVLSGKQVIVVGENKDKVQKMVHTLELFYPGRFPSSIDWTEETIKDKKIVGTSLELGNQYNEGVIVNLETQKVLNGTPSRYCKMLLPSLLDLGSKGLISATKIKIEMLIEFARVLIELSKDPEIGANSINLIKMDVSPDAAELIIDIASGFDPSVVGIIKENWL
ncbi:MAG: hypothetical protein GF308_20970 [Candidatus Heimdallarchaeota archaeon]|nr:hypothetical protein [Candidatus Heimdallarchaeota archaeon]